VERLQQFEQFQTARVLSAK